MHPQRNSCLGAIIFGGGRCACTRCCVVYCFVVTVNSPSFGESTFSGTSDRSETQMPFNIEVNDHTASVDMPGDTPLLWAIRESLELTGTKFGCGKGLCGACTVHVEGQPIRSCVTPVTNVQGKRITTIEGLSPHDDHPVQRAWIVEQVPQCGYCQPGMIMTAAALLRGKPHPTDADIDRALGGHICRCGTYARIRRAVKRVQL